VNWFLTIWPKVQLWAIGVGVALLFIGILLWRVFDAGRNEEKIKTVEATLTNIRRAAEARAQARGRPIDAKDDPWNRDNWGAR